MTLRKSAGRVARGGAEGERERTGVVRAGERKQVRKGDARREREEKRARA